MSDYSPPQGYTRSGKTLKQVRRYYALKNEGGGARGKKRSPARESPEKSKSPHQDRTPRSPTKSATDQEIEYTKSKKKAPKDDDGLARRIANELRVQQEALEMRGKRHPYALNPNRSMLPPIIVQPVEAGGPIFVTETPIKSTKTITSPKGMDPALAKALNDMENRNQNLTNNETNIPLTSYVSCYPLTPQVVGVSIACFSIALTYVISWIILVLLESQAPTEIQLPESTNLRTRNFDWLSANSIIVLVTLPYWWFQLKTYYHLIASFAMLLLSTFGILGSIIFIRPSINPIPTTPLVHYKLYEDNTINYWTPPIFFGIHCVTLYYMWYYLAIIHSNRQRVISVDHHQLSHVMAPHS